jgi:hypothetical protein
MPMGRALAANQAAWEELAYRLTPYSLQTIIG